MLLYSVWRHLSKRKATQVYLYVTVALCCLCVVIHSCSIIHRNALLRDKLPRLAVFKEDGVLLLKIKLSRPLHFKPGQYVNVWIPGASLFAFLQTHPFALLSSGEENELALLVVPRTGFTAYLDRLAKGSAAQEYVAMVSGPHGPDLEPEEYDSVLTIASGFGIIAQLSFLQYLVQSRINSQGKTRKLRCVWIIEDLGTFALSKSYSAKGFTN